MNDRAICIQQMNECAAAIRVSNNLAARNRMRIRLAALTQHAWNMGWLPECFQVAPDLQP